MAKCKVLFNAGEHTVQDRSAAVARVLVELYFEELRRRIPGREGPFSFKSFMQLLQSEIQVACAIPFYPPNLTFPYLNADGLLEGILPEADEADIQVAPIAAGVVCKCPADFCPMHGRLDKTELKHGRRVRG